MSAAPLRSKYVWGCKYTLFLNKDHGSFCIEHRLKDGRVSKTISYETIGSAQRAWKMLDEVCHV